MTLLPSVDEYACCGHGDCAAIAPGVFQVDEIATVQVGRGDRPVEPVVIESVTFDDGASS